jgi:hypothetical protein
MKRLYTTQLWRRDKKLAILLGLFVLGQAFFSYKQIETLPFFNYGMYARPVAKHTIYTTQRLYYKQQPIDLSAHAAAHFWAYQLHYYTQLTAQSPIDAPLKQTIQQRFSAFPVLNQYLQRHLCNNKSALVYAPQWMAKNLNYPELSIWQENYVWVKDSLVLLTKNLVH